MKLIKNLEDKRIIPAIIGPTGSGKGSIGFEIARELGFSIILCDSKKVYRYMDIGTNKPKKEWREIVKYYMIDIKNPDEYYSAGDYAEDTKKLIKELDEKKEKFFVLGGGTLYLKALFEPFIEGIKVDEKIRERVQEEIEKEGLYRMWEKMKKIDIKRAYKVSPNDKVRIARFFEIYYQTGMKFSEIESLNINKDFVPFYIGIKKDRKIIYKRIEERVYEMMEEGFLEEVKRLVSMGYSLKNRALDSHGYKDLIWHLEGKITLDEAIRLTIKRTKEYSRRQMSFFKNYLKYKVYWVEENEKEKIKERIIKLLRNYNF
ncbi:MAG: tRNA (adenosine(37)-N6)-dimethylallyltransferase MiaA [candidate division WOR-3 bacterium]